MNRGGLFGTAILCLYLPKLKIRQLKMGVTLIKLIIPCRFYFNYLIVKTVPTPLALTQLNAVLFIDYQQDAFKQSQRVRSRFRWEVTKSGSRLATSPRKADANGATTLNFVYLQKKNVSRKNAARMNSVFLADTIFSALALLSLKSPCDNHSAE